MNNTVTPKMSQPCKEESCNTTLSSLIAENEEMAAKVLTKILYVSHTLFNTEANECTPPTCEGYEQSLRLTANILLGCLDQLSEIISKM